MTAQMSLVSLGVKVVVASVPGVEGLVLSSIVALVSFFGLALVWQILFWCGRAMLLVCEAEVMKRRVWFHVTACDWRAQVK